MKKWIGMVVLLVAGVAQAGLVLNVDMDADEVWFTGSDSGTMTGVKTTVLKWTAGSYSTTGTLDMLGSLDTSESLTSISLKHNLAADYFELQLYANYVTDCTLTGNGTHVDYSGVTSVAAFESLMTTYDGDFIPLSTGTGFSALQINVVPEPATAGLLGISVGVLLVLRRHFCS